MENVQAEHSSDDHGAIHDIKVQLGRDNPTIPAVAKLDGSVYRPELEDQTTSWRLARCYYTYLTYIMRELSADPNNM